MVTGNPETQVGALAGVAIWTITQSPCGSGTLIIWAASHGPFNAPGENAWRIATGAGTEDLVNASGGGTFTQVAPAVLQFSGKIRCG